MGGAPRASPASRRQGAARRGRRLRVSGRRDRARHGGDRRDRAVVGVGSRRDARQRPDQHRRGCVAAAFPSPAGAGTSRRVPGRGPARPGGRDPDAGHAGRPLHTGGTEGDRRRLSALRHVAAGPAAGDGGRAGPAKRRVGRGGGGNAFNRAERQDRRHRHRRRATVRTARAHRGRARPQLAGIHAGAAHDRFPTGDCRQRARRAGHADILVQPDPSARRTGCGGLDRRVRTASAPCRVSHRQCGPGRARRGTNPGAWSRRC